MAPPTPPDRRARGLLALILALALVLRLAYALSLDPLAPYANTGADTAWYLAHGYTLVTDRPAASGIPVNLATLGTPPVYLLVIGVPQALLAPGAAIVAIRVFQALLGVGTACGAYRLASAIGRSSRAGLVAAAAVGLGPVFILEAAQITTETVYVFLVVAALALFVDATSGRDEPRAWRGLVAAAVLLGLAALTRAVLLLFPVLLAGVLFAVYPRRAALRRAVVLLAVYGVVVSTWTVYNLARWNRLVIAGEGFAAFLYLGATGWDSPGDVDARLGVTPDATQAERQEQFAEEAGATVARDPLGYAARQVGKLAGAYAQPHGTAYFPGESLRALAGRWLREDRTPTGLLALALADGFWPKLTLYAAHYAALLFGLVGVIRAWRARAALPPLAFIAYTSLLHLALLALPRYVFPTEPFWWVFAAVAVSGYRTATSRTGRDAPASADTREHSPADGL